MQRREFIPYDPDSVVGPLNQAVERVGLETNPDFSSLLRPQKTLHLLLADKKADLVARVRPLQESSLGDIEFNLNQVIAANTGGAPLLPPITSEVLTFSADNLVFTATLWPLADNRAVLPEEMAAVLRGIHDSPPPPGLPDWLNHYFVRVRDWSAQLPTLPDLLPVGVVEESLALVETTISGLEQLVSNADKVLLHGDAHPNNVVIFRQEPFGCDLDEICVGPPEVDLSMVFLQAERYPASDTAAGLKLAKAYNRPYDHKLLRAIIDARSVSRLMSLVRFWDQPSIAADFLQRLEAIKSGGRFSKFYGGETSASFAEPG